MIPAELLVQRLREAGFGLFSGTPCSYLTPLINRVMDLQHLKVRQITVPLNKTVTAASNTTAGELLEMYRQYRFTRLPIWQQERKTRRIVGIVNLQTLLYANELLR